MSGKSVSQNHSCELKYVFLSCSQGLGLPARRLLLFGPLEMETMLVRIPFKLASSIEILKV